MKDVLVWSNDRVMRWIVGVGLKVYLAQMVHPHNPHPAPPHPTRPGLRLQPNRVRGARGPAGPR